MSANKPRWRWWLYCAALDLWFRFRWRWTLNLQGWCVLPAWLAVADDDPILFDGGEVPF